MPQEVWDGTSQEVSREGFVHGFISQPCERGKDDDLNDSCFDAACLKSCRGGAGPAGES